MRPRVPTERVLLLAARADRFFPPDKVEAMWRTRGEPEIAWYPGGHMAFVPQRPIALGALRRHLDVILPSQG